MRIEHWRYSIPLWLRGLLRRRAVEQELDEEIRDHIERQTRANVAAGMSEVEARRAALVSFGGVERVKEESREARRLSVVDGIAAIRYSARSLLRARAYSTAAVVTIALAVAAGSTMVSLINAVLLRPLPYPESDRVVSIWNAMPGIDFPIMRQAPGIYLAQRDGATSLESIGLFTGDQSVTVTPIDPSSRPVRLSAIGATASVFTVLRVPPILGHIPRDEDIDTGGPLPVFIGERLWRERYAAAPDIIGRSIKLEGIDARVDAVLPASFTFPSTDVQLWSILRVPNSPYLGFFYGRSVARLRPGVTIEAAQRELQTILMRTPESYPEQKPGVSTAEIFRRANASVLLHTLRQDAVGSFGRVFWLIGAVVAVLVLVAFSNVASLVLTRVDARGRELAVRAMLGASRSRLWWAVGGEIVLLVVVGGAAGIAIASGTLGLLTRGGRAELTDPMLSNAGYMTLPRANEVHADGTLVLTALALSVAFCVIGAAIGTSRIRWRDAGRVLRDGGRTGTASAASQRLRSTFVMIEVALSLVLLSGSAVLARSLWRVLHVPTGFDTRNTMTFWTPVHGSGYQRVEEIVRFYHDAVARVERVPGVAAVGIVSKLPLESGPTMRPVWVEDDPAPTGTLPPVYSVNTASTNYFKAAGIPLLAGRSFDPAIVAARGDEAVVERAFATRYWRDSTGRRALGRRIRPNADGPWYTIVGVVGDIRDTSLTVPSAPIIYLPQELASSPSDDNRPRRDMAFVVRTRGNVANLAAMLAEAIHDVDPNVEALEMAPLSTYVEKANGRLTLVLTVLAIGAATTLLLGIVGVYGVIAYVVSLRSREIGIRIALGLVPGSAARMIVGQGERIIVAGALIGVGAFILFARLLDGLVFGVATTDHLAVVASASLIVLVATVATWIPARRAAGIDPAEVLRAD